MGAMDHQLTIADEVTWNTAPALSRAWEYDSENIEETEGRTEGDPLRTGSSFIREDRFTPYFAGAAGSVVLPVMSKGFGFFIKHLVGAVGTAGPTDSVYTHTGSEGTFVGKGLSMQFNRPLHPAGTNQPFLYTGGKVTEWSLNNSVDENLMLTLNMDFAGVDTATALATPTYPSSMENLTWAGGTVTIGGSSYDITEFGLTVNNGYAVDRRQIRGSTVKKEPTSSRRSGTFSIKADFDSMTQRNRAHATTRSAALATVVGRWVAPTLAGASTYPEFNVTFKARFDAWKGATEGTDAIEQELSGVCVYDGSTSPVIPVFKSVDATP